MTSQIEWFPSSRGFQHLSQYSEDGPVAIRAEQRELLAVFKPGAFGTASGLLTTPA